MQKIKRTPHIDGELGWLETTPDSTQLLGARLKGHHEYDVAIIGGGFTGLSCALRLAEINPDMRIAVIDALRIGEGTSGRNAGFLIDLPHNVDFSKTGVEHAHALMRLNQFAIERLRGFKDRLAIPSWDDAGKYMAAHEQANMKGLDHFSSMLAQAGFDYEKVEGKALAKRLGTDYYRAAIYTRGNVLVNPATLVRGLVQALPANVTLFENSPVQAVEYGSPHQLHFLGGTLQAAKVVQATNSFVEEFGKLSHHIVPIFTYASLTRQLTAAEMARYFADVKPWGLTSAHLAGTTVRLTHDNRVFVRNTYDFISSLKSSGDHLNVAWRNHRQAFESRFPFIREMPFEYTWGGMICMTQNYEPVFSDAGDGIYLLGGCNGVGVVKGTYTGYYMADYLSGIESDNLRFILSNANPPWIPPDPLRAIGAKVRIAWEASTAKGDV